MGMLLHREHSVGSKINDNKQVEITSKPVSIVEEPQNETEEVVEPKKGRKPFSKK